MPLMDDVISYYDKNNNFYNNKGELLNYTVYKDDKNGIYIAKIKRKSSSVSSSRKKTSQLSNKTFSFSLSSSSPVSVNEEKIKLCSRWAFNKRENPERPKKQAKATNKSLKNIPNAMRNPAIFPPCIPTLIKAKNEGPKLSNPRSNPLPIPFNMAKIHGMVSQNKAYSLEVQGF
jgi:hypothetical protein